MTLKQINVAEQFTITTSDPSLKDIGAILELQTKQILKSNELQFSFRSQAVALQIEYALGMGTGIYRRPIRVNAGTDYDFDKGIQKQTGKAEYTTITMEQMLTFNFEVENFDMERYRTSGFSLLSEWNNSLWISVLGTIEAVFMRGVIEYCIATGKYITLDMKGLKTAETATEAYFTIKNEIVDRTLLIDDNTIGTNSEDFSFIVSKKAKMGLLRAHMRDSGTETTHATLATGVLYNNSVLGTMVQEHFFLDQKLPKGKINKDLDFDFSGVQGLVIHNQAVANPKGWESSNVLMNPDTANPKYLFKGLNSLPQVLRPDLVFLILDKAPTTERIKKAKELKWNGLTSHYEHAYSVALWDKTFPTGQ